MKYLTARFALNITAGAIWMGMVGGCVDARGEYASYQDRIVDARTTEIDGMIVSSLPNMNGDFLMAVRPDLPDKTVFRMRLTLTLTPITENTGLVDFVGQPLDVDTLEPVGDELITEDTMVETDASFAIPVVGPLPARANPVTGTQVPLNLVVHGTATSDDFQCGTLTGTAGGLSLDGSTWGSVRITGDTLPPQVLRCEDAPTE